MDFLNGTSTLTAAQAVILTGYLSDYQMNNEAKLQSVLTTIANIGTFSESKENDLIFCSILSMIFFQIKFN